MVEGGAGEPESGGRRADRLPLLADAAEHLVLDLDEIAGIEERVVDRKSWVGDRLGVVPTTVVYSREAGGRFPMAVCGRW